MAGLFQSGRTTAKELARLLARSDPGLASAGLLAGSSQSVTFTTADPIEVILPMNTAAVRVAYSPAASGTIYIGGRAHTTTTTPLAVGDELVPVEDATFFNADAPSYVWLINPQGGRELLKAAMVDETTVQFSTLLTRAYPVGATLRGSRYAGTPPLVNAGWILSPADYQVYYRLDVPSLVFTLDGTPGNKQTVLVTPYSAQQ